jgi:mono/diheme cytochrome c family protein
LIPAFPYNHTRVMTRVDSDAVFAWLGTIPVSEQKQPANTLPWPLSTQPALAVWRSLFFKTQDWQNDATQSAQWNRGAYLVEGMGHCAACHGARNALGSFSAVNDLSGAIMQTQHAWAPSLHDPLQTSIAQSTPSELVQLLTTGVNAHGHVMGPMADYVREVSQYWRAEDALAVATYLKSGQMSAGETQQKPRVAAEVAGRDFLVRGAEIYTQHCESCHGKEGQGQAGRYPPLASNPALDAVPPSNLIQMVLFGGFAPSTQGNPRPWGMPAFLFQLQNEDVAAVLTWTRTQWGHHAPSVKAIDVDQIRSALE